MLLGRLAGRKRCSQVRPLDGTGKASENVTVTFPSSNVLSGRPPESQNCQLRELPRVRHTERVCEDDDASCRQIKTSRL